MCKLVSIIIPAYNVELYIDKCIKSVIHQSYESLEILIIDDGSSDKTPLICDTYAKIDNRITVIHKKNQGVSSARNTGIDLATGEYITFLDGDDYVDSNYVLNLVNLINRNKTQISMCNYGVFYEGQSTNIIDGPNYIDDNTEIISEKKYWSLLSKTLLASIINSKLYCREIWSNLRFKNEIIHEDEEIIHKLIEKCDYIACTNYVGLIYRIRPNSITTAKVSLSHLSYCNAIHERILYFISREYYEYLMYSFVTSSRAFLETKKYVDKKDMNTIRQAYLMLCQDAKLITKYDLSVKHKIRLSLFRFNLSLYQLLAFASSLCKKQLILKK